MQLVIEELSKRYDGGVQALDRVSLAIGPGVYGLLGPNGAGKSTLMRTLATLQRPDTGRVRFDGVDVLGDPAGLRRRLGYLPQDFGVPPKVSAERLLDLLATLKGYTRARDRKRLVDALLAQTNLEQVRAQPLGTFSGGMKQRFGIAQALIGRPGLLVVDEPTAGLDPEERNRFHNLLGELGESTVVLLSTHIVGDVSELCPQVAILHRGRVAAAGAPRALTAALRGRVFRRELAPGEAPPTAGLLSLRRFAGARIVHVYAAVAPGPGWVAVEPDLEDLYFFHVRAPGAAVAVEVTA
ncbi:MAG: ABC transporter ATP-binding protein [Polyangiaceae bacterium]|jgi:ABC-type multidrug transport system ATPase subunit|nr:ABC transporter ATP-binding protein [Polyangiaceae bacterium]